MKVALEIPFPFNYLRTSEDSLNQEVDLSRHNLILYFVACRTVRGKFLLFTGLCVYIYVHVLGDRPS